mmetsp:Transcript_38734/g.79383  ORF Transcript_38734/g.79383 Transcript_38734/m.79383 type:complete len:289 (+) Transcript_38734:1188-2054(+)
MVRNDGVIGPFEKERYTRNEDAEEDDVVEQRVVHQKSDPNSQLTVDGQPDERVILWEAHVSRIPLESHLSLIHVASSVRPFVFTAKNLWDLMSYASCQHLGCILRGILRHLLTGQRRDPVCRRFNSKNRSESVCKLCCRSNVFCCGSYCGVCFIFLFVVVVSKSLQQDGNEEIHDDVVSKSHDGDCQQRRDWRGCIQGRHAVVHHRVPIFCRNNLEHDEKSTVANVGGEKGIEVAPWGIGLHKTKLSTKELHRKKSKYVHKHYPNHREWAKGAQRHRQRMQDLSHAFP